MSKHGKRDILVHFDEETNDLVLYTVSTEETAGIRAKEFDGARMDIPSLLSVRPEEAEQELGETILSMVDAFSLKKTGIRPYEARSEERHRKDVEAWTIDAANGDPEAQFLLYVEYHSKALFECNAEALENAEVMLNAACSQGHVKAIENLENWPVMRAAVERKLKRNSAD